MCYSGQCTFEDHMGECTVTGDYSWFKNQSIGDIRLTSCIVGGFPDSEEAIEFIDTHEKELEEVRKEYDTFVEERTSQWRA